MEKKRGIPRIKFFKQKIGNQQVVCFDNSNLYVKFETPAYFVFYHYAHGLNSDEIVNQFIENFEFNEDGVDKFVNQIIDETERLLSLVRLNNNDAKLLDAISQKEFTQFSKYTYRYGSRTFSFTYETKLLEYYIHPLIAHLVVATADNVSFQFELYSEGDMIFFCTNGLLNGKWTYDETNLFKGKVFQEIINAIYSKTDNDWMMTFHASAITNGRKTILLSAAPGSGKSTLAAMLLARGYKLVSDDFVPVDRDRFLAHPFPIAMSVKEGSAELLTPLFPSLKQKPITVVSPEKSVRFLSSEIKFASSDEMFPVENIFFVSYNREVEFELKKLRRAEALDTVFEQSWIAPSAGNAPIFFKWLMKASFYKLVYSNNQQALDAVSKILENDE